MNTTQSSKPRPRTIPIPCTNLAPFRANETAPCLQRRVQILTTQIQILPPASFSQPQAKTKRSGYAKSATQTSRQIRELGRGKGLLFKCHGALKPGDKIELNNRLLGSPNQLHGLRYIVIDEESGGFQLSSSETRAIAEHDKQIAEMVGPDLVVAIVTPKDVNYGMARMWQVFAEETGWKTAIFRSMTSVGGWLISTLGADFAAEPLDDRSVESAKRDPEIS